VVRPLKQKVIAEHYNNGQSGIKRKTKLWVALRVAVNDRETFKNDHLQIATVYPA
jgi:hypothetical protein